MVLGGHRQLVVVRPADTALVLHVLHYPEHVRVCPQTVRPLAQEPAEELRLAGMLIEAAGGVSSMVVASVTGMCLATSADIFSRQVNGAKGTWGNL